MYTVLVPNSLVRRPSPEPAPVEQDRPLPDIDQMNNGWQGLKDLFRTVENIIRADINIGADDRSKGSGAIVFETSKDAQQAIRALVSMYNGFDWHGCTLEDRYNGLSGPFHGFRGGFGRGGFHGGFQGGYRGSLREGGYPHGPGRDFSGQDLYADYPGPDSSHGGLRMNNCGGYGNSNGGGGYVGSRYEPEPSARPLDLRFNDRWRPFSPSAAKGG
ncbi:hypothetical protein EDD17DRAFT_1509435 [Pisolithus thermaeus]|nr:hypothetical protein EDD17DRAFT_1509435 [Pisolithus thermaeus]